MSLSKEIIKHFFDTFNYSHFQSNDFLFDKKIIILNEDNSKTAINAWAFQTSIENNVIKIIISDNLSEDDKEYVAVVQLNNNPYYGLKIFENQYKLLAYLNNKWVDIDLLSKLKFIIAIESLLNIFPKWNELKKDEDIFYKMLSLIEIED